MPFPRASILQRQIEGSTDSAAMDARQFKISLARDIFATPGRPASSGAVLRVTHAQTKLLQITLP
jgi:hypothetical protein